MFPPLKEIAQDAKLDVNEVDTAAVRFIYYSPAWENTFDPLLRQLIQGWLNELVDPSVSRKWARNDDFLRGAIAAARALLNYPAQLIEEEEKRFEDEKREKAEQDRLLRFALDGRGPLEPEQPLPSDPV